jgi:hypothetical protein
MKQYGKKIGRGLKNNRNLDNGCPCCGREYDNKTATRIQEKKEIKKTVEEQEAWNKLDKSLNEMIESEGWED